MYIITMVKQRRVGCENTDCLHRFQEATGDFWLDWLWNESGRRRQALLAVIFLEGELPFSLVLPLAPSQEINRPSSGDLCS